MSGLFTDTALQTFVPLAVLGASLSGSLHCVGMCGGLVSSVVATRRSGLWLYHAGRLLSYSLLGALAGGFGQALLSSEARGAVSILATALMAATLIALGLRLWRSGGTVHFTLLPAALGRFLFGFAGRSPFLIGLFTGFLPCGWLHSFLLGAAGTQSAPIGALLMGLFWLGTLPALSATSWVAGTTVHRLLRRAPRLAAALLIGAGLLTLGVKFAPRLTLASPAPVQHPEPESCH